MSFSLPKMNILLVRRAIHAFVFTLVITSYNLVCFGARIINEPPMAKPFTPNTWQSVLTQAVDPNGNIAFERLKAQPKLLNLYLEQLKAVSPDTYPDYFPTPQDKLAYWLNAYNALSLRLILDRYPVDGLHKIPNMLKDRRYNIGNTPTTLEIIQERIEDEFSIQPTLMPKALFALSINSQDSPPLAAQAYQAATLKQQLEAQAKRFLANPKYVRITHSEYGLNPSNTCAVLRLSPWFAQIKEGLNKSANSKSEMGLKLSSAKILFDTVQPFLAPTDVSLMMIRCPHGVGYLPPNPTLREWHPAQSNPKPE